MGIDDHEQLGFLIKWELLVSLTQINLSEMLYFLELCKQVLYLWNRLLV